MARSDALNKNIVILLIAVFCKFLSRLAKLMVLSCQDGKTGFEIFFRFLQEFQAWHQSKEANVA